MAGTVLKRASREDLLEMLKDQEQEIQQLTEENESLKSEVEQLNRQLEGRPETEVAARPVQPVQPVQQIQQGELQYREFGTLAEATMPLQGVFMAAQQAADQYVDEIRRKNELSGDVMRKREEEANAKASEIVNQAKVECEYYRRDKDKIIEEMWRTMKVRLDDYYAAHKGLQEVLGDILSGPRGSMKAGLSNERFFADQTTNNSTD